MNGKPKGQTLQLFIFDKLLLCVAKLSGPPNPQV
jgi:hypothetical protein